MRKTLPLTTMATLGESYFLASYRGGMREISITDIENQSMTEIGFDTYPENDNARL